MSVTILPSDCEKKKKKKKKKKGEEEVISYRMVLGDLI
jgi:hypothetical protein